MTKALRINDPVLVFLALLVTGLGLVFIFDAGYARSIGAGYGAIPKEFRSQLMFLPIALICGAIICRIGVQKWEKASRWLWIISVASLILPFLPGLGVEHNGASRWFKIGPAEIQPAEFIKVSVILFLAAVFATRAPWPKAIKAPKHFADAMDRIYVPKLARFMPFVWVIAAALLIEKEPDMGTAFIVGVVAFVMMFVGGVSRKSLITAGVLAFVGVGILVAQQPYRMDRILHHGDRWSTQMMDDTGYQTVQSELAMASGGLIGVGPGAGRAKHVEPAATTDFMLATIAEEFGFVGVMVVLGVLCLLVLRLFQLSRKAPTRFGSLVLMGVGSWIGIQTILNVMMANATLPAIGVPLPFISSGGSSLVALWLAIGLSQAALSKVPEPATEEVKKRAAHRNRWRNRRPRLSRA
ncbi:MAG TPA: FtsW/RodA/SpoVE family cell cycle protein [Fimbriimonadaceae bacterium]|jgi:cell division protein FtsW